MNIVFADRFFSTLYRSSYFFLMAILFLGTAKGNAQDRPLIEVKSEVDTAVITIGDRIRYAITIDRQADLQIAKPGEGLNLGMFEIKDYTFHEPRKINDRLIERYEFEISVYDTGKFVIPPFPVAYFTADTSQSFKIIEAPAIEIYVRSLLAGDEARELKDIKYPIYFPFDYGFFISMGLLVILVGVLIYLAYKLWKRRQEKGYLFSPPPPPRPAHEIALQALDELFRSDWLENRQYKAFFSRLSEIIRHYLEGRYFVAAMEQTTTDILTIMPRYESDPILLNKLEQILRLSDVVKFAKYIPDQDEIESVKNHSLEFIEQSKIVFETEQEAAVNGKNPEPMIETSEDDDGMLTPQGNDGQRKTVVEP